jgi:hypothetical protein
MANTESKRSIPSAQPSAGDPALNRRKAKPRKNKPLKHSKSRASESTRSHRFEQVRGKILDFVEFYTSGDYHCLDVRFQDNTAVTFAIEPRFTVAAEHADWKTGNLRLLQEWPAILSSRL